MKKGSILLVIGLLLVVVGCSPLRAVPESEQETPETEEIVSTSETTSAEEITINIEVPSDADVTDIPWIMAVDLLKEKGYNLNPLSFSETAIEVAAMAQGDLDVSGVNNQVAWAAIEKGAPIATFVDKSALVNMVMVGKDIQSCSDLDGKPVAVPGITSVSLAMFNSYMEKNCPGAEPQIMPLSGGSNRLAALTAGEVSASIQDIDDLLKLERENPGEYYPLIVYADEFPGLQSDSILIRREFAEKNPEIIKDIIRAEFTARQSIQDPEFLKEAIIKYLEMEPEEAQKAADVYLAQNVWDTNFLFTYDVVKENLEFLQKYGDLSLELTPEMVADLSFYNEIVREFQTK